MIKLDAIEHTENIVVKTYRNNNKLHKYTTAFTFYVGDCFVARVSGKRFYIKYFAINPISNQTTVAFQYENESKVEFRNANLLATWIAESEFYRCSSNGKTSFERIEYIKNCLKTIEGKLKNK